jgi:hypothetical protein
LKILAEFYKGDEEEDEEEPGGSQPACGKGTLLVCTLQYCAERKMTLMLSLVSIMVLLPFDLV